MNSICQEAHEIINERKQEKDREYGPIDNSLARTAVIANSMGSSVTTNDVYNVLIGLKLARIGNGHKRDNYLDAIAYLQAKYNFNGSDIQKTPE